MASTRAAQPGSTILVPVASVMIAGPVTATAGSSRSRACSGTRRWPSGKCTRHLRLGRPVARRQRGGGPLPGAPDRLDAEHLEEDRAFGAVKAEALPVRGLEIGPHRGLVPNGTASAWCEPS